MASKPLKITYLTNVLLKNSEADAVHIAEVVQAWANQGSMVTVVMPRGAVLPLKALSVKQRKIWVWRRLVTPSFDLSASLVLGLRWLYARPDVVYVRMSPLFFGPLLVARLLRLPIAVEVNGAIEEELPSGALNKLLGNIRLFYTVERAAYRWSRLVVAVTPYLKHYVESKFAIAGNKVIVIENGVNVVEFCPAQEVTPSTGPLTIGYPGGLVKWQGVNYIVEAFARVVKARPNTRLVIAGDGPERAALKALADKLGVRSDVTFMGPIRHEDMPALMRTFTIGVAYYIRDRAGLASPFKVYEYLSCGLPVVMSDVSGISDVFADAGVVNTVPPEDAEALATALIALLGDDTRRRAMGTKGRKYIVDGHSWQSVSDKILLLLEQIRN